MIESVLSQFSLVFSPIREENNIVKNTSLIISIALSFGEVNGRRIQIYN